ncbi:MAG: response regulator transcription factor [Bacilli bacterium]
MFKILIVEDEIALQTILEYDLSMSYQVTICDNGLKALDLLNSKHFDLAIVDWMIPDLDGLSLIKKVRTTNNKIKLMILSAKNEEMDIVRGLEAGADDYLSKPFSPRELSARIKVLLKHNKNEQSLVKINQDTTLNIIKRAVYYCEKEINLSKLEFDLLSYLIEHPNIVLSRTEIMEKIWGYDYESDNRAVDVYVYSLKKKLNLEGQIQSKRGVGYIFTFIQ